MTIKGLNTYTVNIDDRETLKLSVDDFLGFIDDLGKEWNLIREKATPVVGSPTKLHVMPLFKTLPEQFVVMLDDAASITVCDEEGCLERPHADWDFCKEHGEPR